MMARRWKMFFTMRRWLTFLMSTLFLIALIQYPNITSSKVHVKDVWTKEKRTLFTKSKTEVRTEAFDPNRGFEADSDYPDLWLQSEAQVSSNHYPSNHHKEDDHGHMEYPLVSHDQERQGGGFETMLNKGNGDNETVGLETAREPVLDIGMAIPNETVGEKNWIYDENKEMARNFTEEAGLRVIHESEIQKNGPPQGSQESQGIVKEAETQSPPSNILIVSSLGRSGTSFLGGLLSSMPGVFYIFEPLHDMEARNLLTEKVATRGLQALFSCNIDGLVLEGIQKKRNFNIRHKYVKTCKKSCFSSHLLNSMCRSEPIRLVKTIRTPVAWLPQLLEDAKSNLKVFHLVRDPRPTLLSIWKVGWNFMPITGCSMINRDLQHGRNLTSLYPGRYFMVRYEDLCDDPWGMANIIFKKLGYNSLPPSTVKFLRDNTVKKSDSPFGITRNTSLMQQKWRTTITQEELAKIEGDCNSTIMDLGFNPFYNLDTVRNLSVALHMNSSTNKFFLGHSPDIPFNRTISHLTD